jgi:hypothetical protein
MGFLDKVGKVAKDVGKGVIDTGKTIKKGIDDNIERQRQKRILFSNFTIADFKKICSEYGIGEPTSYDEDFLAGERERITLKRDDWLGYIEERLSAEQVEEFCRRHRIRISETYQGKKTLDFQQPVSESRFERPSIDREQKYEAPKSQEPKIQSEPLVQPVQSDSEFEKILQIIQEKFEPEESRDEKELEKQLTQILKLLLPNKIDRQSNTAKGRIDIVIDGKYGLELKIANSSSILRALKGQVQDYKKVLDEVAIILLDVNKLPTSEIREFVQDCKEFGVKTIIVEGRYFPRKHKDDVFYRQRR